MFLFVIKISVYYSPGGKFFTPFVIKLVMIQDLVMSSLKLFEHIHF